MHAFSVPILSHYANDLATFKSGIDLIREHHSYRSQRSPGGNFKIDISSSRKVAYTLIKLLLFRSFIEDTNYSQQNL